MEHKAQTELDNAKERHR